MANSAADARGTEMEIRRKLIESGAVDVMISIGSNFFYTVTLPCTLWFWDRGKAEPTVGVGGEGKPTPYDRVGHWPASRRTRDLLLPKLISGEIDVSNLDTRR